MASPFLFAAGFTQGLAQGVGTGFQLYQQKQLMDLQKRRSDLESISAMANVITLPDPAMREMGAKALLPSFGVDIKSDQGKNLIQGIKTGQIESLKVVADQLRAAGIN